MAKNFRIVEGSHPVTGEPIRPTLSTKDIDALEAVFAVKPQTGLVYKGERHVTRVSCPRGIAPNDELYSKSLSYSDDPLPVISYINNGVHYSATCTEFVEWLGKDWEAEEARPDEAAMKADAALEAYGRNILAAQDPEKKVNFAKEDEKAEKKAKEGKTSFKPFTPKKKFKKSSKK